MGVFANTGIYGFLSSCKATGKQIANKAGILAKEYVEYFVSGFAGHGWKIWEYRKGKYKLEIDTLFVRETMTVFEMLVQKIRALVGSLGITQGCGKIKEVASDETNYYLTLEDETSFVAGDFVRCQSRRADATSGYWVKVLEIRDDGTVVIPKSEFTGEIVSSSGIEQVVDSTAVMAAPAAGDEVVQFGNENPDSGRNSAIYLHADENGEPAIDVLFGITSKSFANCVKVRMGGDIPGSGGRKGFYCENGMIKCVDSSGSLMYQLNPDGSFNLGRGGINYDPETNTLAFGKNVRLTWDNIDPAAQEQLKGKDAEMHVIEFLNENRLAVTNILASGLGKPVTPGDVEGFLYKVSGNTKTALEAFWKLTVTDQYGEAVVSHSEAVSASFAFDPGSNLDGRLYTLAAYTGANGTGDKLVEATIPKILDGLSADTLYPWLEEWDGHKTTILDEEVVSPKMFSGKKNDDGTLTGAAFGRGIVYVDGKEKIGSFGIKNGKLTFFLDAETGDVKVEGEIIATSGKFTGEVFATNGKFTGEIDAKSGELGTMVIKDGDETYGIFYSAHVAGDNTQMWLRPGMFATMPNNVFDTDEGNIGKQMNVLMYLSRNRGNYYDRALYVNGIMEIYGRLGIKLGDKSFGEGKPALVVEDGIASWGDLEVLAGGNLSVEGTTKLDGKLTASKQVVFSGLLKGKTNELEKDYPAGTIMVDTGQDSNGWCMLRIKHG